MLGDSCAVQAVSGSQTSVDIFRRLSAFSNVAGALGVTMSKVDAPGIGGR